MDKKARMREHRSVAGRETRSGVSSKETNENRNTGKEGKAQNKETKSASGKSKNDVSKDPPVVPSVMLGEEEEGEGETSAPLISPRRPIKTALHQAVLDLRIHQVRLLVQKHRANVDCRDMYGRTPLMLACLLENEEYGMKMMRIFIKAHCSINISDNMKRTALHYACMKGRLQMTQWLTYDDSVAVNDKDNDGNSPLMLAALGGNPRIVEHIVQLLLHFGLSCDDRNKLGYTALMLACKYGHYASAYILLTKGVAQSTLRDNEYFLTAAEWLHKSAGVLQTSHPSHQRSHTAPPLSSSRGFDREHSLYMARYTPQCHHVKTAVHPLGQSLHSTLHLPALFCGQLGGSGKPAMEAFYEGVDARNLLLKEMEAVTSGRSSQHGAGGHGGGVRKSGGRKQARGSVKSSLVTSAWTQPCGSSAATHQLIAITPAPSRDHRTARRAVPAIRMLFRLYSDQYDASKHQQQGEQKQQAPPDVRVQFSSPAAADLIPSQAPHHPTRKSQATLLLA